MYRNADPDVVYICFWLGEVGREVLTRGWGEIFEFWMVLLCLFLTMGWGWEKGGSFGLLVGGEKKAMLACFFFCFCTNVGTRERWGSCKGQLALLFCEASIESTHAFYHFPPLSPLSLPSLSLSATFCHAFVCSFCISCNVVGWRGGSWSLHHLPWL